MKLFLSWSGEPARTIALALRDLIDMLCKDVVPWVSSADIKRGARWGTELAKELSSTNAGIIVLTPNNLQSEWLLFEAGALSKSVEDGQVHPLLVGVDPDSLPSPLSQFQATIFHHDDVRDLISGLASSTAKPGSQSDLFRRFDEQWPALEMKVADSISRAAELAAALATAQQIDSAAAAERAAAIHAPTTVAEITLNGDHTDVLKFLASADGVKQPCTSIAKGLGKSYDRVTLHVEELAEWGYVSEVFSPAVGPVFGLDTKGRKLAMQFGWI